MLQDDGFAAGCEAVAVPPVWLGVRLGYAPGAGFAPWDAYLVDSRC